MATLLLAVLLITELGFCVYELTRSSSKSSWTPRRFMIDSAQLVIFLIMAFLPGIDFSFRFRALLTVLVLRLIVAGIFTLAYRSNEKSKKRGAMVMSALISIMLIATNMIPAFVFADYHGRPLTGEYEVKEDQLIMVDESRPEQFENDGSYREVPVHFYYPDDESLEDHSLPLVIFSHGAFGYYQSNASTYMELASHGYVVASLDHPYHSFFTHDTDGKLITVISRVRNVQNNKRPEVACVKDGNVFANNVWYYDEGYDHNPNYPPKDCTARITMLEAYYVDMYAGTSSGYDPKGRRETFDKKVFHAQDGYWLRIE